MQRSKALVAVAVGVSVLSGSGAVAGQWRAGGDLGVNIATVRGEVGSVSSRSSFLTGLSLRLEQTARLAFQGEVLAVEKGFRSQDVEVVYRLFQLPVLARYAQPLSESVSFHVLGGSYLGLKVERTQANGRYVYPDPYRSYDLGLLVGAGVDMRLSNVLMTVGLRHDRSLVSISAEGRDVFNSGVALVLGFEAGRAR